ncbi:hypothetical protein [Aquabacterium sp. CECT 9606]|uniref:hypothetical protein n=1 Tax=Aquabacterium sp. CECT 9606 TaxID=2845822 RepID=UPI001E2F561D|nr:hypothetical protein [Aquabacterium sp. CECT 9606]
MEALPALSWSKSEGQKPAAETAALMLYVALNFMVTTSVDESGQFHAVADGTYVALGEATGLSRALIADGLQRLQGLGLIHPEGSNQKRRYRIAWPQEHRFFKLPCQAIVKDGSITAFKAFNLRSKHELHALKLFIYLAAIRNNNLTYSMASYEKIFERTRIPERDIRRAIGLLIGTGLLEGVDREHSHTRNVNEPNKYYLKGCTALVNTAPTSTSAAASNPAASRQVSTSADLF